MDGVEALLRALPFPCRIHDAEGALLHDNGREPPPGFDAGAHAGAVLGTGHAKSIEFRSAGTDGKERVVEALLCPAGDRLVCLFLDRTRERTLEEELRRAAGIAVAGRLAAGATHDFNNILTAVSGGAQLLLRGLEEDDPRRIPAENLAAAGERGEQVTRRLLALSRVEPARPAMVALDRLQAELGRVFSRLFPKRVRVLEHRGGPGPYVVADPSHLEQILLHCAVEFEERESGRGTLELGLRRQDSRAVLFLRCAPAGDPGGGRDRPAGLDREARRALARENRATFSVGEDSGEALIFRISLPLADPEVAKPARGA